MILASRTVRIDANTPNEEAMRKFIEENPTFLGEVFICKPHRSFGEINYTYEVESGKYRKSHYKNKNPWKQII